MQVFECPSTTNFKFGTVELFLGGGISGCSDWQRDCIAKLSHLKNLVVFNPRRSNFDISNAEMSKEQIDWEEKHLHSADIILFWFAPETLCPITLYELGVHATRVSSGLTFTEIVVGCHPEYKRKFDVEYQLSKLVPKVKVRNNLDDLVADVMSVYDNILTLSDAIDSNTGS